MLHTNERGEDMVTVYKYESDEDSDGPGGNSVWHDLAIRAGIMQKPERQMTLDQEQTVRFELTTSLYSQGFPGRAREERARCISSSFPSR